MTDNEKIAFILANFKMSDDGKMPIPTGMVRFYRSGRNLLTYIGNKTTISATQVAEVLRTGKWPIFTIHRIDNTVDDFSIHNLKGLIIDGKFKCIEHTVNFPLEDCWIPIIDKHRMTNICIKCRTICDENWHRDNHSLIRVAKTMYSGMISRDTCNISEKEFVEMFITAENCAICGEEFTEEYHTGNRKPPFNRSKDKSDPKLGYTNGNVQIVHNKCNRMKSNYTMYELYLWCEKVLANRGNRK